MKINFSQIIFIKTNNYLLLYTYSSQLLLFLSFINNIIFTYMILLFKLSLTYFSLTCLVYP